jgi:hypothetical protein
MTVTEIHAQHAGRAITSEEFEQRFGDVASEGEG